MPNTKAVRRIGRFGLFVGIATVLATAGSGAQMAGADGGPPRPDTDQHHEKTTSPTASCRPPVHVRILTPRPGDNAGVGGLGWIVNLSVRFPDGPNGLQRAGFTAPQLTGPGVHANAAPFPGAFSPGQDDRFPGLVVLVTTSTVGAGPGQNLANLFNLTGVSDRTQNATEITDDWLVGAAAFGKNVQSEVIVAVVKDLNGNGIFDDAPNVVPDANKDGKIDVKDVKALGLASNVDTVKFRINGNT